MIEKVHEHIIRELQQNSRTDTVFMVTGVLFNLIVLAVNSGVASSATSDRPNPSDIVVFSIFVLMLILVNTASISALISGKQNRAKLLSGLIRMYSDNEVDTYYDSSLLAGYQRRYLVFIGILACLALTAIAVPFAILML